MKSLRIILLFLFLFLLTNISIVSASGIEDEDMDKNAIEDAEELIDDTTTNSSMTQSEREQLLKEIEEKEKKLKELEESEAQKQKEVEKFKEENNISEDVSLVNISTFITDFYKLLVEGNRTEDGMYYVYNNKYKIKKDNSSYFPKTNIPNFMTTNKSDYLETIKINENKYLAVLRIDTLSSVSSNPKFKEIDGVYQFLKIEKVNNMYEISEIQDFKEIYGYKDLFTDETFKFFIEFSYDMNYLNEKEMVKKYVNEELEITEEDIKEFIASYREADLPYFSPYAVSYLSTNDISVSYNVYLNDKESNNYLTTKNFGLKITYDEESLNDDTITKAKIKTFNMIQSSNGMSSVGIYIVLVFLGLGMIGIIGFGIHDSTTSSTTTDYRQNTNRNPNTRNNVGNIDRQVQESIQNSRPNTSRETVVKETLNTKKEKPIKTEQLKTDDSRKVVYDKKANDKTEKVDIDSKRKITFEDE